MFRRHSQLQASTTKRTPNKLIAGFAALSVTAIMAASGFAAAAPADKPSKQWCQQHGFSNYGQCVKEWAHNKNKPGHGYGGGNTSVATNVNLTLNNSDHNIIHVIVNIFR